MSLPIWNDDQSVDFREFLSTVIFLVKVSKPGAERVCLEKIQAELENFIKYKEGKEEEKENARRIS